MEILGEELRLRPAKTRRSLEELLAATSEGLHRVEGWDGMSPVGGEETMTGGTSSIFSSTRPAGGK